MVGTPPIWVARSRSTSAMAASGSNRRISTTLSPVAIAPNRAEKQPVTWNSGMHRIAALLDAGIGRRRRLAAAQVGARERQLAGEDRGDRRAMAGGHALGVPGGAGGVEQGRLVLGRDRARRGAHGRQVRPGVRPSDQAFEQLRLPARLAPRLAPRLAAAEKDAAQAFAFGEPRAHALEALGVEDRDSRAGVAHHL